MLGYFIFIMNLILLFIFLLIVMAFFTLLERKLMGATQRRKGPNVVGILGYLQPIADGVKLLVKEIIIPYRGTILLYFIGPVFVFIVSVLSWGWISLTPVSIISDINLTIWGTFVLGSLVIYGFIIAGWSSNSRYSFLGGVRATAQMIAYELLLGTINLFVALCAGSYNYIEIINAQKDVWFCVILFPVFLMSLIIILAETNRTPFDLAEAEAELVAGYNVEYSAFMFALFFLGEYANMFLLSTICVLNFLGGWTGFFSFSFLNLVIKVLLVCVFFVIVRATLPRYRYDQLMDLGWKHLLPFSFGFLIFFCFLILFVGVKKDVFLPNLQELFYNISVIQQSTSLVNTQDFNFFYFQSELELILKQFFSRYPGSESGEIILDQYFGVAMVQLLDFLLELSEIFVILGERSIEFDFDTYFRKLLLLFHWYFVKELFLLDNETKSFFLTSIMTFMSPQTYDELYMALSVIYEPIREALNLKNLHPDRPEIKSINDVFLDLVMEVEYLKSFDDFLAQLRNMDLQSLPEKITEETFQQLYPDVLDPLAAFLNDTLQRILLDMGQVAQRQTPAEKGICIECRDAEAPEGVDQPVLGQVDVVHQVPDISSTKETDGEKFYDEYIESLLVDPDSERFYDEYIESLLVDPDSEKFYDEYIESLLVDTARDDEVYYDEYLKILLKDAGMENLPPLDTRELTYLSYIELLKEFAQGLENNVDAAASKATASPETSQDICVECILKDYITDPEQRAEIDKRFLERMKNIKIPKEEITEETFRQLYPGAKDPIAAFLEDAHERTVRGESFGDPVNGSKLSESDGGNGCSISSSK